MEVLDNAAKNELFIGPAWVDAILYMLSCISYLGMIYAWDFWHCSVLCSDSFDRVQLMLPPILQVFLKKLLQNIWFYLIFLEKCFYDRSLQC